MSVTLDAVMRRFIRHGVLDVRYPDGSTRRYGTHGPHAGLWIDTRKAEFGLIVNPGLLMPEAYMDGGLRPMGCSLYALMEVLMMNVRNAAHPAMQVVSWLRRLRRAWSQFNPAPRSRRNVAHHYDLNGRLYSLFLDRDLQYSCAYFAQGDEALDEAQEAKKHHIAAKLKLDRPGLRVLDIGCGWGGMALTLARDYGAQVTGITLSTEQLDAARARAVADGLAARVQFELTDYRDVRQRYDRIVSVGMFEHVGITHYREFFGHLRDCLTEDGVALIHAIGRADGPRATNAWIEKYIFPGGYAPALSETTAAIEQTGLWITDIEVLRLHYAKTIAHWRRRFAANRAAIASLYDERFCRMFELYLVSSELAFRRQMQMNFQIQLTRDPTAVPLTRDYMIDAERRLPAAADVVTDTIQV
ncbi:class I SAM-dependent methyltransferase [Lichenicoccus sp.]|uniref:class I SAM-dependent methyltransferase n=1 Tax=Lichenicoccus sp. TaxID=2781899 RepID=UPI003D137A7D